MTPRSPITVAIARFEDLLALGLRTLLESDPSVEIVAHDIAPDRLAVVLRAKCPRVLILDVARLRDLAQVRRLSVDHPQTRLVLLGQNLSPAESGQLLAFGASACLAKDTQSRDIQNAIHLASRGLQLMPLRTEESHPTRVNDPLMTHREGDVLLLLRQGQSNAQIALALGVGIETVRTHARSIFRKLGVSSRRALIALSAPAPAQTPTPPHPARRRSPSRVPARRRLHP
jgi:DNA-binding NarL/FixJ family response regulator